jgi:hypothetical protein
MKIPVTFFAPAEREPLEVVHLQADSFKQSHLMRKLHHEKQNYVFLLNARRQIVDASRNVLELTSGKKLDQIIGLRPGEALGCIHAQDCESGCGTSRLCSKCGGVKVILAGLDGYRAVEEYHLTRLINGKEEVLKLRALGTPLVHQNERYTLFALSRVSHKQR